MGERKKQALKISNGTMLRELEIEHAQQLWEFINACWRSMKLQGATWAEELISPDAIRKSIETLDPSKERRFGLWDQGLLVGVVRVIALGMGKIQIDYLLNPVFGERDSMQLALKQLAKAFFSKGKITTVVAHLPKTNVRAIQLFDQIGFVHLAMEGDILTYVLKKWQPFFLEPCVLQGSYLPLLTGVKWRGSLEEKRKG